MADLLSTADREFFQDILGDLFDTFKRTILIHKEPIKKIINPALDVYAGYAEDSTQNNIEYIHQNREFEALVSHLGRSNASFDSEINVQVPKNASVRIKLKSDARDYIMKGKTERLEIDGNSYNIIGNESLRYNFGFKLYVFYLEQTK